ncbi:hypothetical protein PCANC_00847 [Puccinia coronata f. sp. avenae]|uniref:Uncharacterized protein n=1 Tax=Puccinia coronata f. sp. avenae TaxID=200324 RepID=A0A2N5TC12_9BASI|nr:hypothetical protein PCANC_10332 [Puccinia coronata f. sp. avenae]PLW22938.1 hypothetical protein PCASD_12528 [Puccinia coronata f. sp. avenae]PLW48026.1 hypothetical protein PCASD_03551 [Puccinia coronata f. sp. avenae]PLW58285.1 hypothetical protein PCANC_00847 [Puccinia coronata f. sp. avenae]
MGIKLLNFLISLLGILSSVEKSISVFTDYKDTLDFAISQPQPFVDTRIAATKTLEQGKPPRAKKKMMEIAEKLEFWMNMPMLFIKATVSPKLGSWFWPRPFQYLTG